MTVMTFCCFWSFVFKGYAGLLSMFGEFSPLSVHIAFLTSSCNTAFPVSLFLFVVIFLCYYQESSFQLYNFLQYSANLLIIADVLLSKAHFYFL